MAGWKRRCSRQCDEHVGDWLLNKWPRAVEQMLEQSFTECKIDKQTNDHANACGSRFLSA